MASISEGDLKKNILLLVDEWSMVSEPLTSVKIQHWINGELEVEWGELRECQLEVEDDENVHEMVKSALIQLDTRDFIETRGSRKNEEVVRLRTRGQEEVAKLKQSPVFEPVH